MSFTSSARAFLTAPASERNVTAVEIESPSAAATWAEGPFSTPVSDTRRVAGHVLAGQDDGRCVVTLFGRKLKVGLVAIDVRLALSMSNTSALADPQAQPLYCAYHARI